ncbi:MAG: DUF3387 domain-containing protein [Abditibacteriota bacterium]|nr:DUF3387 domain-containing protein [Abditibacteriota bacterium]
MICSLFSKAKRKNLVIKDLEELIQEKINNLITVNPTHIRMDYYKRYQAIIDEYNSEQDKSKIEKIFNDLMRLVEELTEEEKRYIREEFDNDEELAYYDMLFRENLSKNDIKKLKEVAVELYNNLKVKIEELDNWKEKDNTRATVRNLIKNTLYDKLPDSYATEVIPQYIEQLYEYVYSR